MNFEPLILKSFKTHSIFKVNDVNIEVCPARVAKLKSEGIKFNHELFYGEIFVYYTNPIYCEIEYFVFKNEIFESFLIEFNNEKELITFIKNTLDKIKSTINQ